MSNPRGPGRPAMASLIWEDTAMQRKLVRLYLYTSERSLSTKQMSNLITELAREKLKRFGHLVLSSNPLKIVLTKLSRSSRRSLKSKPESRTRSTQNQLRTLLASDYHRLRARNREVARARLDDLRLVRSGRIEKRSNRRKGAGCIPISHLMDYRTGLEIPKSGFDIETTSKRTSANSLATWISTQSCEGESPQVLKPKQRVRVSWIRDVLGRSSEKRPSSSVILDIRSLISTHSFRSSLFSSNSSSVTLPIAGVLPFPETDHFKHRNKLIIELCCQWQPDCLHRKAAQLATGSDLATVFSKLALKEGSIKDERDIWNASILHLLAQWGTDISIVSLLSLIVHYCERSMVTARNIDGDTFLHILARRWSETTEVLDTFPIEDLITLLGARGFRFDTCNSLGDNALVCFVPEIHFGATTESRCRNRCRSAVHTLHSLFKIKDAGRFLLEPFVAIYRDTQRDRLSEFLWSDLLYNETLDDEIVMIAETREWHRVWREAASIAIYRPIPSLHTFLQHQTVISIELLDQGADPNEYNKDGKTCLMALLQKSAELQLASSTIQRLTQMLLDRGASTKLCDRDGDTALHHAVRLNLPDVVDILIKAGASLDARNTMGKTCTDIAITDYELTRHLRESIRYAGAQTMLVRLFDGSARRIRRNRISLPGQSELQG